MKVLTAPIWFYLECGSYFRRVSALFKNSRLRFVIRLKEEFTIFERNNKIRKITIIFIKI